MTSIITPLEFVQARRVYQDSYYPYPPTQSNVDARTVLLITNKSQLKGWKDVIAKRQNAALPYYKSWASGSPASWSDSGAIVYTDSSVYPPQLVTAPVWADVTIMSGGGWDPFPFSASDPISDDIALKRIKSKLANGTNQFNALAPLVELREFNKLTNQIAKLTISTVKTLIDLKHGKLRLGRYRRYAKRNVPKYAANIWLTHNFGIKPMMSDAENLAKSLATFFYEPGHMATYHGGHRTSWSETFTSTQGGCQGVTYNTRSIRNHTYSVLYTAGVYHRMKSSNDYGSLANQLGLSYAMVPSAGWELTPFSWIADYFSTAGEFLEDAFVAPSGDTVFVTKSVMYKCESQHFYTVGTVSPLLLKRKLGGSTGNKTSSGSFQRTVLGSLPHRALRMKTTREIWGFGDPDDNLVSNLKKLTNLAAILIK